MRLLFDQNISFRIIKFLEDHFDKVTQVRIEGLINFTDKEIWEYARANDYMIVTFDADFYDFSVIWGSPPKIILIRSFDQRTVKIADLIIDHKQSILAFYEDQSIDCLTIVKTITN
jgi:predicted nuclease of predicted toxin-antitoxin system